MDRELCDVYLHILEKLECGFKTDKQTVVRSNNWSNRII